MRSARYGGGQSTAMRCAKLSGTILLLALMMRPSRGLLMDGSSSKGTKPIQSNSPLQPGTGCCPLQARPTGTHPGAMKQIGRTDVLNTVTNTHPVCRLLLAKKTMNAEEQD